MPPSASRCFTTRSESVAMVSLKMSEPCVERTPATSQRSLMGTGRPASLPRSWAGNSINRSACSRARPKQSVTSALTGALTAAMRFSRASRHSSGETAPMRRRSVTSTAVRRVRSVMGGMIGEVCRGDKHVCRNLWSQPGSHQGSHPRAATAARPDMTAPWAVPKCRGDVASPAKTRRPSHSAPESALRVLGVTPTVLKL
jgi:hypothetical protein